MTRTQFIRAYAERSGLSHKWAELGFIEVGDRKVLALPCGCEDESCDGWAMVTAEGVLDHLFLYAPDELMAAYRRSVEKAGGV